MKFNKINKHKNVRIVVDDWSNEVRVYNVSNGEELGKSTLSDHIKAILVAKKLMALK